MPVMILSLCTIFDHLSHLTVKTEIMCQTWLKLWEKAFHSLEKLFILLPHASAGLSCRNGASQWQSCSPESVMCRMWGQVWSFITASRVHLVCSFLSVCLFHFHAPDWFKLNCPSCSYHIYPQQQQTPMWIQRQTYNNYTYPTVTRFIYA